MMDQLHLKKDQVKSITKSELALSTTEEPCAVCGAGGGGRKTITCGCARTSLEELLENLAIQSPKNRHHPGTAGAKTCTTLVTIPQNNDAQAYHKWLNRAFDLAKNRKALNTALDFIDRNMHSHLKRNIVQRRRGRGSPEKERIWDSSKSSNNQLVVTTFDVHDAHCVSPQKISSATTHPGSQEGQQSRSGVTNASARFKFGGSFGRPREWDGQVVTDDTMKVMLKNGIEIKGVSKVSISGTQTIVSGMVTNESDNAQDKGGEQ
jgi:hypothetical protein